MKKLYTIARYTLAESYHNNLLRILTITFITCLGASYFFGSIMLGSYEKVLCDGALASFQLATFLLILFYVIPFFTEQERKHLLTHFVTHPITRTQFLLGVTLGFIIIHTTMLITFYVATLIALYLATSIWFSHLFLAFVAVFIEGIALIAAGLCASILCSRASGSFLVVAFYVLGHTNNAWYQTVQHKESVLYSFATFINHLLPDFALLDIKQQVIYQIPFEYTTWLVAITYTLLYSLILLIIALKAFKRMKLW